MAEKVFDIAVVGSGPGGYVAALKAAQMGAKTVVVEQDLLGGTCLNRGCIPSKALLASAELLHSIHNAGQMGIKIDGQVGFDWPAIQARKDKVLARLRSGIKGLFSGRGVALIEGRARLSGPNGLVVTNKGRPDQTVQAKKIILAPGSVPATISGWPSDQAIVSTSDQALHWKDLPRRILIVGGGAIGCEFACMLHEYGVKVTLVEMLDGLLPGMEPALGRALRSALAQRGIELVTSTKVEDLKVQGNRIQARLGTGQSLEVDRVLVATGRRPNTKDLGLEGLGIGTDKWFVQVNDRMQTGVAGIYCIGDANGRCMLAHAASAQGVAAVEDALGHGKDLDLPVPWAVYTFPQVASVGLTSTQAAQQGIPVKIGHFPIAYLGKAQATGHEYGFVMVIRHRHEGTILGMHMVGQDATEIIEIATAMIGQRASAADLGQMIFAHPTISEAVKEAAEDTFDQALHMPPRRVIRLAGAVKD